MQPVVVSVLLNGYTCWTLEKHFGTKARRELHKDSSYRFEQILEEKKLQNISSPTIYIPFRKPFKICWSLVEK